jgi:hypothetical protein
MDLIALHAPKRSGRGREDRHLNFYRARDNLTWLVPPKGGSKRLLDRSKHTIAALQTDQKTAVTGDARAALAKHHRPLRSASVAGTRRDEQSDRQRRRCRAIASA